ncbi:putative porin [Lentisalinibacter sediminis]|uniref:putative porin n=1 Tax=Lentisalinibacter sediminis TaxID=2992237 RepID=UPI0038664CE5
MRALLRACIVLGVVLAPAFSGAAAVSQEEIRELRAQIAALSERLAELEERAGIEEGGTGRDVAAAPAPAPEPAPVAAPREEHWTDRVAFSGDFRYRWETIDQEGSDSRERHRIRVRPTLTARVNDTVRVGVGLATGGDNPVSGNQTLGDGGSRKDIGLDQAWFEWTGLSGTRLVGGKFRNPLRRPGGNGLVWDDDWRPEGLALDYATGDFFATALATWLESDSRDGDELAIGLQGGYAASLRGDDTLTLSASHYRMNLAGRQTLFDPADAFGNSVNPDGTYRYDFSLVEFAAEYATQVGGWPVALFADYVRNLDAGDYDTGWAVGGALGKASAPGTWRVRYTWQELEADAVLGLLTDSNFGGGGTDARGHFLSADYALAPNWVFRLSYFRDVIDEDAVDRGDPGAKELDYDRLILDFRYKY